MLWTRALRKMPWTTLLAHAPTIVDAARNVYATTRKPAADGTPSARAGDGIERLRRAVEELEAGEAQQAALFADLAKQVQAMTTALAALRARVLFALVGAALALVVAIVTSAVLLSR